MVKKAQIGAGAAIKIEHAVYQSSKAFGRQYVTVSLSMYGNQADIDDRFSFDEKDELISHISRQSIDVLSRSIRLSEYRTWLISVV